MRNHSLRAVAGAAGGGAPTYDADAQAMFDKRVLDSDEPSAAYKQAISDYVTDLKAISGHWDTITQLVVFAGATTVAGGLRSIKGPDLTHSNLVAGDFALKTGVKGNASNKHIVTGYDNTSFTQNNMHTYALLTESPTNNGMIFGNGNAGTGAWSMVVNGTTGNSAGRCRSTTADSVAGISPGGYGMSRSVSGSYNRMVASSVTSVTRISAIPNASPMFVLASSSAGSSSPTSRTDARILVWAIGPATTLGDYTTPGADLITALNAI